MPENSDPKKPFGDNLSGISLGMTMAVGVAFFTYLGYLVDQKTGGGQGWTLAGNYVGLFYCGYEIWKLIRNNQKKDG